MESYYFRNHKVLNMHPAQLRAVKTIGNITLRPLTLLLESLGLYLPMQRRMGSRFEMNQLTRPAFGAYQATAHDVIVSTYPKSGTYWMIQIAHQIANRGASEYEHIHDVVPWPDGVPSVDALPLDDETPHRTAPTGLRVIKSHLAWGGLPYSQDAKYISVIRDPKETFVSSYFFVQDVGFGPMMPSVDTWLELYLSPDFLLGSWAEHVASMWTVRDFDNVLVVSYHDMKRDPQAIIGQVVDFLGVQLTAEELERVSYFSSFAYMKSVDMKFHPGPGIPLAPATGNLIRNGKSGRSSEMLSVEQQRRIDSYMRAEIKKLVSDFPYDDLFQLA